MGIKTIGIKRIGLKSPIGTGIAGSPYWKPLKFVQQSECYELWQITGAGNIVGLKRGDVLTVGGSINNYTFQVPNTAPYIAKDADYIWFYTIADPRTVTSAELIGFDFSRTIIKYADASPYGIEWIMILSSDLSIADENKMRDAFHLSVWWSNVLSSFGSGKGNRGQQKSTWVIPSTPAVTTTAVSSLIDVSASSGGNVTSDGGAPVTARGICWNTSANPTTVNSKTTDGTGTGVFTSSLTGLSGATTYHIRAYVTNAFGTAYGADVQFSTYDVASQALFVRMDALSETPADARKVIIDTGIKADKALSFWSAKYDAFWLLAAHGTASAKQNIITDALNITPVSTPVFTTDRGFTGDEAAYALNTNLNTSSAVKYTQNSCSFGIYVRDNIKSGCVAGNADATHYSVLLFPWAAADNKIYAACNSAFLSQAGTVASGMWILSRIASDHYDIYHNGTLYQTVAANSVALADAILYLLCRNSNGTLGAFSKNEIALAFVGAGMSSTEVANFQTVWVDGYLNSIGAEV